MATSAQQKLDKLMDDLALDNHDCHYKIKDADSPVVLESFSLPNTGTGTIHLEGALKFVPDHGVTQELSVKAKRHIESVSGRSIFFANVEDGLTKMDDVAVTTKKDEDTRAGCSLAIHHHD